MDLFDILTARLTCPGGGGSPALSALSQSRCALSILGILKTNQTGSS
jgi:hypothetical protein